MLRCDPFACEAPGSGLPGAQPFGVTVDPLVFAIVDFHSHLLSSEIIGFLGGHWDAESRQLHLREAFPCRSISSDTGTVHVELDPLAEVQVRAAIEGRNMKVVGWYHSHPVFSPQPSIRDVQNQQNYQFLFHDQTVNMMPFIGLIISPYEGRLSSASSALTMFYVEPCGSATAGTPKRCTYESHSLPPLAAGATNGDDVGRAATLPRQTAVAHQRRAPLIHGQPVDDPLAGYWEERLRTTCHTFCALVHYYKRHRSRIQLKAPWKKKVKHATAAGGALPFTKLEKLIKSVRSRVVDAFGAERVDPLLQGVVDCIDTHWVARGA